MLTEIKLIFHNRGLRSFIEVDLCARCPRQDDKGCCGYYSPVFYPTDFAYLLETRPDLLEDILQFEHLTVLDSSLTINHSIDGNSYRCHFHRREGGCLLSQELRETICRHFVCPGINWESDEGLVHWKTFFERLFNYEIELNDKIALVLKEKGLSLRNSDQRQQFFEAVRAAFEDLTRALPAFFAECPSDEEFIITRRISYGNDWPL